MSGGKRFGKRRIGAAPRSDGIRDTFSVYVLLTPSKEFNAHGLLLIYWAWGSLSINSRELFAQRL